MPTLAEIRAACLHATVERLIHGTLWCADCGHVLRHSGRLRGRGTVGRVLRLDGAEWVEFRCLGCGDRATVRREDASGWCPWCLEARDRRPLPEIGSVDPWGGRSGGSEPDA